MAYLLPGILFMLLAWGPQLWVRHVMRRYRREIDLPGTGGELAEHLIRRFELEGVKVESTDSGTDHYDPGARRVRLSPEHLDGRSLTAIAVAAHEVGHAIQFHRGEPISRLRRRWLPWAQLLKQVGLLIFLVLPLLFALLHVPQLAFLSVLIAIVVQLISALTFLIVLPEEWDASFNKALPILVQGEYIDQQQLPAVRRVLKAAALTYFAAALADVVNIARWLLVLRRG